MDDLGQPRVPDEAGDTHVERPSAIDGAGVHLVAWALVDRQRLPGERRLVDIAPTRRHHPVERHLVAWAEDEDVVEVHVVDGDRLLDAVPSYQRLTRRQIDEGANGLTRVLHGAELEPLRHREQEHDARCLEPLSQDQRTRHRHHHEDIDVDGVRADRTPRANRRVDAAKHRRECKARGAERPRTRDSADEPSTGQPRTAEHQHPAARNIGHIRRFFVLEPHAHTGLSDSVDHDGRREPCDVVFDVKTLADEVGGQRFEADEGLQPSLEDDDLVTAVHALDAEHGLRVEFAR